VLRQPVHSPLLDVNFSDDLITEEKLFCMYKLPAKLPGTRARNKEKNQIFFRCVIHTLCSQSAKDLLSLTLCTRALPSGIHSCSSLASPAAELTVRVQHRHFPMALRANSTSLGLDPRHPPYVISQLAPAQDCERHLLR